MQEAFYEKPNFQLYKGDCLKILKDIPNDTFDMVFADPPYHLSNGGFTCQAGKRVSVKKGDWDESNGVDNDFEFDKAWIKECKRVLKPNGTIWISGTYHSIYACGFALQKEGYKILNDICWYKPNAAPNLSGRYFAASHETLLWARKEKDGKHQFNYSIMKNGDWHENDLIKNEGKQMRSVWAIGTPKPIEKKFGKHPTQKPEELLKRVILSSTNQGDLILDPFTGSSTTGIVAYKYGRRFVGIEMDELYLNLSIQRFEELEKNINNKALLNSTKLEAAQAQV